MYHILKIENNCSHPRAYSARWDAYYCKDCDRWIEGKCGDPDCDFCRTRPEKPSLEEKPDQGKKT